MACYDLAHLGVLQEEAYRKIGGDNLSVWSRRVIGRAVGYERLELRLVHGAADVGPQGGKALIRLASADREQAIAAADALTKHAAALDVRVFQNALPEGQTSIMVDAPTLALIPDWSPAELASALGDLTASLIGVSRYTRYRRR
jgi:hypothetical protein